MGYKLTFVDNTAELERFGEWLPKHDVVSFDTETTGIDRIADRVRLMQFGHGDTAFAIPEEWFGPAFEIIDDYKGRKVIHNAAFDMPMIQKIPQLPRFSSWEKVEDTMIMARVIYPIQRAKLETLAARFIRGDAGKGQLELKKAMRDNGWTWATIPTNLPVYWLYGCLDTIWTIQLFDKFDQELHRDAKLRSVYELEMAILPAVSQAESNGITVDRELAKELDDQFNSEAAKLHSEFVLTYGCSPNEDRLADILIAHGAKLTEKTPTGKWKMTAPILEGIDHPIVSKVLDYRRTAKLASTYTSNIYEGSASDGRIRPSFKQIEARTGRFSCARPNLQNLPARQGPLIRNLFVASKGNLLISCDYSSQEFRIMAHLSQDPALLAMFQHDVTDDPFLTIGQLMYPEDPPTSRTDQRRTLIKTLVYGLSYGIGVRKFAHNAEISFEESKELRDRFYETFPGVATFMRSTIEQGRLNDGVLSNMYGRRIAVEVGDEYKLTNYRIQSVAADQIKAAVRVLWANGLARYLRLFIHDEIVVECPEYMAEEMAMELEFAMVTAANEGMSVHFPAEAIIGERLGELK